MAPFTLENGRGATVGTRHTGTIRYWTADLHFGHANVIGYCGRPYVSAAAMDEALVANWNATVDADDEVWILGDIALGDIDAGLANLGRLRGHKVLVPGNHDRCWEGRRDRIGADRWAQWRDRYLAAGIDRIVDGWTETDLVTHVGSVRVRCCHFPYRGDSGEVDRFPERRPVDDGMVILHGHVHEKWRRDGRQINVGVDVWDYRPVAEDVISALVAEVIVRT